MIIMSLWYWQLVIVFLSVLLHYILYSLDFLWITFCFSLGLQPLLYMWRTHSSKPSQHVCLLLKDSSGHLRRNSQASVRPLLQAVWTVRSVIINDLKHKKITMNYDDIYVHMIIGVRVGTQLRETLQEMKSQTLKWFEEHIMAEFFVVYSGRFDLERISFCLKILLNVITKKLLLNFLSCYCQIWKWNQSFFVSLFSFINVRLIMSR